MVNRVVSSLPTPTVKLSNVEDQLLPHADTETKICAVTVHALVDHTQHSVAPNYAIYTFKSLIGREEQVKTGKIVHCI